MISAIQLFQKADEPNIKYVQVLDFQGNPAQYRVTDQQFNQLAQLGFQPQTTFSPLLYQQGNLPSLNFLKQGVNEDMGSAYEKAMNDPANSGSALGRIGQLRKMLNRDLSSVANVPTGLTEPMVATSKTPVGQALAAQNAGGPVYNPQGLNLTTASQGIATNVPPNDYVTLTSPQGDKVTVLSTDAPYWQSQGWTPSNSSPAGSATGSTPTNRDVADPGTGLTGIYKDLYDQLQKQLDAFTAQGKVVNPNVEITPDKVAEFTKQAESEIHPYYATKLKQATDSFYKSLGYTQDQLLQQEAELERKFKAQNQSIASTAADQGFALSGMRKEQENQLAASTNLQLQQGRQDLAFKAGQSAADFAQNYGASALTPTTISPRPFASAGETHFGRPGGESQLYSLSPDIYSGLVGSEQYAEKQAVNNRASQLEDTFNSTNALKNQRYLTL